MQNDNRNSEKILQFPSSDISKVTRKIVGWIEADELAIHKAYKAKDYEAVKDLQASISYWTNKLNHITHSRVRYNEAA